jgi:hypothetical protein
VVLASRAAYYIQGKTRVSREQLDNGGMSQVFGRKWSVYNMAVSGVVREAKVPYSGVGQSSMFPPQLCSPRLATSLESLRKRPDHRETRSQPCDQRISRARIERRLPSHSLTLRTHLLCQVITHVTTITCHRACRHCLRAVDADAKSSAASKSEALQQFATPSWW